MKLGILVSGELGLKLLLFLNNSNYNVVFVMTDTKSLGIINYCLSNGLNYFVGNPRTTLALNFYKNIYIDVLISINYLFLVNKTLINLPNLLAFNVHGSLLPKYRGRTPHIWAIINNEFETGITAHVIDEGCDTGDIIYQIKLPILPSDSGNDLLKKFELKYVVVVTKVLELIKTNKISFTPQLNSNATFFGKRTPEDGQINWDWQKERIRNWVRALTFPYPGAFTFSGVHKIIIDEVSFVDFGFESSMPNGLLLSLDPFLVKTPNGVIELKSIRFDSKKLELNTVLK